MGEIRSGTLEERWGLLQGRQADLLEERRRLMQARGMDRALWGRRMRRVRDDLAELERALVDLRADVLARMEGADA